MNIQSPIDPPITEPRRHMMTVDEWIALKEADLLNPDVKFELIDGELIEMPADGFRTILWNTTIMQWLFANIDWETHRIVADKTLQLNETNVPSPDLFVMPVEKFGPEMSGYDADLIIEIADSTVAMDTGIKREKYAEHGVRDYWVVLCEAREIWVYRQNPTEPGTFLEPQKIPATDMANALLIENLSLCIDDFDELKAD